MVKWLKSRVTFSNKFVLNMIAVITFIIAMITFLFMVLMPHTILKNDINIANIQQSVKEVRKDVKTNYKQIQQVNVISHSNAKKMDINNVKIDKLLAQLNTMQRTLDFMGLSTQKKKCKPDDIKCIESQREVVYMGN